MLRKKRKIRLKKESNPFFELLKRNFLKIISLTLLCLMIISIIGYFFEQPKSYDVNKYNERKIKELNLEKIYIQKNLNHNEVEIWVLNNTETNGLAAKIRDCLEKGYQKDEHHIKGDYYLTKQDNLKEEHQKDIGKTGIYFYPEETEIIIHNNESDFKSHIQELLFFTGFESELIKYNYKKKLYDERDITIILGNDWENSNLQYCQETKN